MALRAPAMADDQFRQSAREILGVVEKWVSPSPTLELGRPEVRDMRNQVTRETLGRPL
jgi:hypothetical protein